MSKVSDLDLIKLTDMVDIKPIGDNQKEVFDAYKKGHNQFVFGAAGTGKTFVLLYNALKEVLNPDKKPSKIIIVRAANIYGIAAKYAIPSFKLSAVC